MENNNNSEELKQLNINFGEAEKSMEKGEEFFKIHLSDELIFRRANGAVNNKKQFLEELVNPKKVYHEIRTDVQDIFISEHNKLAMVTAIVYAKLTKDGKDIEGNYINLRFFRMEGEVWMLIIWYNNEV